MSLRFLIEGPLARRVSAVAIATVALAQPAAAQDAPPRRGIGAPPPPAAAAQPEPAERAPLDPAWVGAWMGAAAAPDVEGPDAPRFPFVFVVRGAEAGPVVEVWSLPAAALGRPAIDVVANGRALAFTLDSQGEAVRFEGTVAVGDALASGSVSPLSQQRRDAAPQFAWRAKRVDIVSELAESRVFAATLEVGGQKLPMRLALGEGPSGWCGAMDILVQGVRDFPVAVTRTEKGFGIEFPAAAIATIDLAAKEAEKTLSEMTVLEGTFRQATFSAPIRFEFQPGDRAGALRRPQEPKPPFPYRSREVTVAHPLGHALAGTLTMPEASPLAVDGRVPAVVCVSGSGPQDRDETLMGHRPFAVLADALTRAGVAVLRYDDRGTAKSTGAFVGATTADFASDADMAVEWLKRQPGIDPARIGLLGHSEGGLIGPLVAAWQNDGDSPANPLAFLVLIAPPGETGGQVLTRQTRDLAIAGGAAPEKVEAMSAAHAALMEEVAMRRSADALRPAATALVREQIALSGQPIPDDATLRMLADRTAQALTEPWMSEFIRMDPRAALLRLEVPTLAVWGTKDLQVDAVANSAVFTEIAAAGAPIETRVLDGLNHLLQPAAKGTIDEYGEIELTIDPAALEGIVSWVTTTARAPAVRQVPEASRSEPAREAYVPPRLFYYREPAASGAAPASGTATP